MKKFEELTDWSQIASVDVLKNIIAQDHQSRGDVDGNRIEYFAHSVREAFIALESERLEGRCSSGNGLVFDALTAEVQAISESECVGYEEAMEISINALKDEYQRRKKIRESGPSACGSSLS
ncbi:hypothetical protein [Rosenbergiella nectarea]|uniref:hypothetical protein n=1 Tax=Rosenbergiella nectarea TaxID=988801 RepID=UPI001F4E2DF3|nr:hypothetical protein [Rosenbergiella nectarea]